MRPENTQKKMIGREITPDQIKVGGIYIAAGKVSGYAFKCQYMGECKYSYALVDGTFSEYTDILQAGHYRWWEVSEAEKEKCESAQFLNIPRILKLSDIQQNTIYIIKNISNPLEGFFPIIVSHFESYNGENYVVSKNGFRYLMSDKSAYEFYDPRSK